MTNPSVDVRFVGNAFAAFRSGTPVVLISTSPEGRFQVVFEDDGQTGYLYGLELDRGEDPVIDAALIYGGIENEDLTVEVLWFRGDQRVALLVHQTPQAVIDFRERRTWCRSNFPEADGKWAQGSKEWSDVAVEGM